MIVSSTRSSACQHPHAAPGKGPAEYQGGAIGIYHNGEYKGTIPAGLDGTHVHEWPEIVKANGAKVMDIYNDKFELRATSGDGVCITGIQFCEKYGEPPMCWGISFGKNNQLRTIWLDGDTQLCENNFESTNRIVMQFGQVISSACKGVQIK